MVPRPNIPTVAVIEITNDIKPPDKSPADFEQAISASGHGLFNYLLLFAGLPCCAATLYETSTVSYILPSADCDLHLTLTDKGILNAVTYAGMIMSAIPWGYLSDKLGRRKLLIYGYLLDSLCVIMCSLSQNVWTLIFFKFLGGFIMCGPFAVLMSYISEFHGTNHRSRVMMVIGMFFSLATISLPAVAWFVIPKSWTFDMGPFVSLKSWQMFLALCSLPSLISGITITFFPESPKFLMSKGRNEEALIVFQTIFRINTGGSPQDYPIKNLVVEPNERKASIKSEKTNENTGISAIIENGLGGTTPLLRKPLLGKCMLVFTIQFCGLLGLNTVRLWLPQLFSMVSDFENLQTFHTSPNDLCSMILYSVNKSIANIQSINGDGVCTVNVVDTTYVNTMIVGLVGFGGYLIAGALINAIGSKNILIYGLFAAGGCGLGLYWAENSITTVVLSSLYTSIGSISSTALIGVVINMFPTSLRTMTISLCMMFGRLGALIGNVIFPYLLQIGCLPPFLLIGCIQIVCSLLCMLLPKTNKTPLQ